MSKRNFGADEDRYYKKQQGQFDQDRRVIGLDPRKRAAARKYQERHLPGLQMQRRKPKPWQKRRAWDLEKVSKAKKTLESSEVSNNAKRVSHEVFNDMLPIPEEAKYSPYFDAYAKYKQTNMKRVNFLPQRYITYVKGRPVVQLIMTHPEAPVYEYASFQAHELRPTIPVFLVGVTGRDARNKMKSPQFAATEWVLVADFSFVLKQNHIYDVWTDATEPAAVACEIVGGVQCYFPLIFVERVIWLYHMLLNFSFKTNANEP